MKTRKRLINMVGRGRFELPTNWLKISPARDR